jgi:DNA invertase Pin-like site-specific DNA recombinase
MERMKYGYARVSTDDQNPALRLIIFGVPAPPTPNKTISIACDVEIARSIDQSR